MSHIHTQDCQITCTQTGENMIPERSYRHRRNWALFQFILTLGLVGSLLTNHLDSAVSFAVASVLACVIEYRSGSS